MLYLASSSTSRANLLKEAGINFEQIFFNYDENIKEESPYLYAQKVVLEKQKQFFAKHSNFESVLFADSIVCIENQILTKPKNDDEALKMLNMQSGRSISVISAMILILKNKKIINLSKGDLVLDHFDNDDMLNYIDSKLYQNKAGGVMSEGFHKKYIKKIIGNQSTILGLNIEILKAFYDENN
ncbi:septum formation inhibitor Maf [Campylobacter insulaenigrae]|uniref:Nucleoside triphosphate pyrophosphatase n=1 Tax=Campylobacter insulaenigrae TaxID=260714 RepID=A0ABY3G4R3_9BACT|nr:septum formation inhibitor Maf [Campylobacter insulaenigrae]MCR6584881.1 septum formation inhibitor Maf [Campylobacter insulaenigrae]TWO24654.1 septum formation inhibitor Maf [Campylobacter insulaenigrae]